MFLLKYKYYEFIKCKITYYQKNVHEYILDKFSGESI